MDIPEKKSSPFSKTLIGLSDLLYLKEAHKELQDWDLSFLNFDEKFLRKEETPVHITEQIKDLSEQENSVSVPLRSLGPSAFCRMESIRIHERKESRKESFSFSSDLVSVKNKALLLPYKSPFLKSDFLSFFHREFLSPGRKLDLEKIVKQVSKGDLPEKFYKDRFSWKGFHLICDCSSRLSVYMPDQAKIVEYSQSLPIESSFTVSICRGMKDSPEIQWPPSLEFHELSIKKGMKLLLLSDLGLIEYEKDKNAQWLDSWLERGKVWSDLGAELYALFPGQLPSSVHKVQAYWKVLPSEKVDSVNILGSVIKEKLIKQLAVLLFPSYAIDSSLLRAVRMLLPESVRDLSLEALFWRSTYVEACGDSYVRIKSELRSELRKEALEDGLFEESLNLILGHHAGLGDYFYWSVYANLGEENRYLHDQADKQRLARKFFEQNADCYYAITPNLDSDSCRAIDGSYLWGFHNIETRNIPNCIEPEDFPDQPNRIISHFDVDIRGDSLSLIKKEGSGSFCLSSKTFRVQPLISFPLWSSSFGEDDSGYWSTFTIGDITQKLRWIPSGIFMMGSPESEGPQHEVTISKGFWLFETPCTQAFWLAVMGENPSNFKDRPEHPVENVSWDDCQEFFKKLTEKVPGLKLELPSEVEWEYSCRAGSPAFHYGEELGLKLDEIAWYAENSKDSTQAVAQKAPNNWGLFDTLGNVWEWCADGLREYSPERVTDPRGPEESRSSLRGGGWGDSAVYVRAAYRDDWDDRDDRSSDVGFRPRVQYSEEEDPSLPRHAERLGTGSSQSSTHRISGDTFSLPLSNYDFRLSTDMESLDFSLWTKPLWASSVGRDKYGLRAALDINGLQQKLRWISPGRFLYGDSSEEKIISEGFWFFETLCTQELWQSVEGENPSHFIKGKDSARRPVEKVNFNDCVEFCKNLEDQFPDLEFSLPGEVEWEYSCRAGSISSHYGKDLGLKHADIAWYAENSRKQTQPVGKKLPNTWGLYDTLGNVNEWCWNESENTDNPSLRGGSWYDSAEDVRAAYRFVWNDRAYRNDDIGFRPRVQERNRLKQNSKAEPERVQGDDSKHTKKKHHKK